MKWVGLVVCLFFFGNALAQKQITVKADEKLDVDFSKYNTFGFASHVDSELDEGVYFLNDLMFKGTIREAVEHELEGLGYKSDEASPDLIVNFRVFDQPVTLKGYQGEGYGSTYWTGERVREPEDTTSYQVEAGTLLISMLDSKTGQVVWQGFASGLINDDVFVREENAIKEAVNLIFEEYDHRANEYSKN